MMLLNLVCVMSLFWPKIRKLTCSEPQSMNRALTAVPSTTTGVANNKGSLYITYTEEHKVVV